MIVGADVNAIVTSKMIKTARDQTGQPIQFWGRYFKDAGNTKPEQYQPKEAALLHEENIRVLPIARQTEHVSGSKAQGQDDGESNAGAIVAGFGATTLAAMPHGCWSFSTWRGRPTRR
jgi:hypothetical protein